MSNAVGTGGGASSAAAPAPALPSFYGARGFVVSNAEVVSSSLLRAQAAAQASLLASTLARTKAAAVGRMGQSFLGAKERRIRARLERARTTSVFAAASTKLQRAADQSEQQSYFDRPTHDTAVEHEEEKQCSGAQTARSPSQHPCRYGASSGAHTARASTAGGCASRGVWDSSRPRSRNTAELYREGAAALITGSSSPVRSPVPRTTARWNRRVEEIMRRQVGGGGAMDDDFAAEAEARARRQRPDHEDDEEVDFDEDDMPRGHQSLFSSPIPPANFSSAAPYGLVPSPTASTSAFAAAHPALTHRDASASRGSRGHRHASAPAGHFDASLRTYTQQWWVRLHNSENRENASPYYIGNKSVYYSAADERDARDQRHQEHAAQARKEWEEQVAKLKRSTESTYSTRAPSPVRAQAAALPSLASATSTVGGSSTLRKLVTSSNLAPASARGASAPAGSDGGLFNSGPIAPVAPVPPPAFARGTTRFGSASARGPPSSARTALLSAATAQRPLDAHALGNLPPAWENAAMVAWRRGPKSMTLGVDPRAALPPPPPLARPPTEDELALERVSTIREANRRRGASCLYDPVSELHGFLSQKNISQLLKATNYNRRELYTIYVRFKALCALSPSPRGIDKATFKKGVARLAVEDDRFVDRVFSLVDGDGSGEIEWEEFLSAMAALEKGDAETKCRFFFQVYDLNADGFICRQDLSTMFHSSSMLDDDGETSTEVVHTFVERLFKQFKAEDKISFEDVMRYMRKEGEGQDVWDIFGRSMLQDFGTRPR